MSYLTEETLLCKEIIAVRSEIHKKHTV